MNCPLETRENAALLVSHAARERAPDTAVWLDRHIAECAACRRFIERQQAVWEALDSWQPEPISPDFNRRLYARIEKTERQVSWWHRLTGPLGPMPARHAMPIAATAVVLLAAGVLMDRSRVPAAGSCGEVRRLTHRSALTHEAVVEIVQPGEQVDAHFRQQRVGHEMRQV